DPRRVELEDERANGRLSGGKQGFNRVGAHDLGRISNPSAGAVDRLGVKRPHRTTRFGKGHARCDNSGMSWALYLFGSGQALFLGAGMILAGVALLPHVKTGWRAAALAMLARLGLVIVVLSAVPL